MQPMQHKHGLSDYLDWLLIACLEFALHVLDALSDA